MNGQEEENIFGEFRTLFLVMIILSVISATSLTYQTWEWFTTGECGCNPAFNQHAVLFGVPVSLIGLVGMITFAGFAFVFFQGRAMFGLDLLLLYKAFFALMTMGLAFVLYLMYISYVVVGEICQLCVISQTITIMNWLISARIFLSLFKA